MGKFIVPENSDGIGEAEDVIINNGGTVSKDGLICYLGEKEEVWDAIIFLRDEWDYALIP